MQDACTQASSICSEIRSEIIAGSLPAASRLKTRSLAKRFGVGLSPVREALSRLSSEGWVTQSDRRGFAVEPISLDALKDLHRARRPIEEAALRDSIEFGDSLWEESVQLCNFRLARLIEADQNAEEIDVERWNVLHRSFHLSLLAGCRSTRLLHYCEQLYDAVERYRLISVSVQGAGPASCRDHGQIADAAVQRKADLAVQLLSDHVSETIEFVAQTMSDTDIEEG